MSHETAGYAWMLDVLLRIIKRKAWWQHARWPVAADNPCDHPQTPVMRKPESMFIATYVGLQEDFEILDMFVVACEPAPSFGQCQKIGFVRRVGFSRGEPFGFLRSGQATLNPL